MTVLFLRVCRRIWTFLCEIFLFMSQIMWGYNRKGVSVCLSGSLSRFPCVSLYGVCLCVCLFLSVWVCVFGWILCVWDLSVWLCVTVWGVGMGCVCLSVCPGFAGFATVSVTVYDLRKPPLYHRYTNTLKYYVARLGRWKTMKYTHFFISTASPGR